MATVDFPSNSNVSKTTQRTPEPSEKPESEIKKPIAGKVTRRKPTVGEKFKSIFDAKTIGDAIVRVVTRAIFEEAVPAMKQKIVEVGEEIARDTLRSIFLGPDAPRGRSNRSSHRDYQEPWRSSRSSRQEYNPRGTRRVIGASRRERDRYEDVLYDTKDFADSILEWMNDVIEDHGKVSVANLLEEIGEEFTYTDNKWGWTDLRQADIIRVPGEGWSIKFPIPVEL